MLILSEAQVRQLVGIDDAMDAVAATLRAMAKGDARNYPVVREAVGTNDAVFGVKAGADVSAPFLGLKAGGYWPGNMAKGMGNHQSSTLLFDSSTGRAVALVSANYLTGIRTGAASALATSCLARGEASVLGIIGTGGQSPHQLAATARVRNLTRVHGWDADAGSAARFRDTVEALGLEYVAEGEAEAVAKASDVIITVTPSQKPILLKSWIKPGTHVSAMGAETKGKQELDPALVAAARLFVDEAAQAVTIGEFQHAFAAGLIDHSALTSMGAVLNGTAKGRQTAEEVTIFDGTGVALQDLVVADLAHRKALANGAGTTVDY